LTRRSKSKDDYDASRCCETTARTPIVQAALRDEDRGTGAIAQPSAPAPQPPDQRLRS